MWRHAMLNEKVASIAQCSHAPYPDDHINECFSGVCNGTLGELLQAPILHEGKMEIAIVSLPVQRFSWAHFIKGGEGDNVEEMLFRPKCKKAISLYLEKNNLVLPAGSWVFSSELPRGCGMASSTADLVATLRCLDAIFDRQSTVSETAEILGCIERSDSVFLDTYALYLSGVQKPIRLFPGNFTFHVFYINEGNVVDTDGVTSSLMAHYKYNLKLYSQNLSDMVTAFERGDLAGIASSSTQSAVLGNGAVPKKNLSALLESKVQLGADGIVVAHTGSLIGYLFAERPTPAQAGRLSAFFRKLGYQCQYEKAQF